MARKKRKSKITQGRRANINGHKFEEQFVKEFKKKGYKVVSETDYLKNPKKYKDKFLLTNVKYTSIYGCENSKTEFVIINGDEKVRVECKYQARAGSVDEKFVYTLLNALLAYPEDKILIVIDGGGYKQGARKWIQDTINNGLDCSSFKNSKISELMKEMWELIREEKDIKLMNAEEFKAFIENEC